MANTSWRALAFATRYDFTLFSNFTFLLNDAENGDGIVQNDGRVILGVLGDWSREVKFAGLPARYTIGAGTRSDRIDIHLGRQAARRRLGDIVYADVAQDHGYVWADQEIDVADAVSLRLGVRVDAFRFAVSDGARHVVSRARAGPKLGLSWRAARGTSLFANFGTGFHSNDARAVVTATSGEEVLPRALGGELGARHAWQRGTVGLAAWWLDLESELVYVGDEGTTEPGGATRRVGLDVDARVRIAPRLWADLDVSLAQGRFRDLPHGQDRIPLAPHITSSGGLTLRDLGALTAGLRYRAVGARPADETNTVRARGHALLETFATWRFGRLEATLTAENLLDADWNEAQFATTSRLQGEQMPVTELHFTPGTPRMVQLGLTYRLR
jgi:outer membrane receptor protein involved in Fe transport